MCVCVSSCIGPLSQLLWLVRPLAPPPTSARRPTDPHSFRQFNSFAHIAFLSSCFHFAGPCSGHAAPQHWRPSGAAPCPLAAKRTLAHAWPSSAFDFTSCNLLRWLLLSVAGPAGRGVGSWRRREAGGWSAGGRAGEVGGASDPILQDSNRRWVAGRRTNGWANVERIRRRGGASWGQGTGRQTVSPNL